ncbi:MAG: nitroreductase family protein [Bacteroidales bacterium]|nr:nitroreductase family protein [Bacteroidales bacterium]
MKKIALFFASAIALFSCAPKSEKCCESQCQTRDFLTLAHDRYSVRKFASTPIEQEKVEKILEAGRIAPTAVNSQPQMVYVAQSEEAMAKLNEVSPCIYGAPQCIILCYNDNTVNKRGEFDNYGQIDGTIVLTHMMMEATDLGLGSCLVGYFDEARLVEAFNLPSNIHPILLMPFGYAAEDATPSPKHTEYRPAEETIAFL